MTFDSRSQNDHATVTDAPGIDLTGDFTFAGWFYKEGDISNSPTFQEAVASKWVTTGNQRTWLLRAESDATNGDHFIFRVSSDGSTNTSVSTAGSTDWTNHNEWLFIAAVFEASTAMTIYVGSEPGAIAKEGENTTSIPASAFSSTADLRYMKDGEPGFILDGAMFEAMLIGEAASEKQVNELSFGRNPVEMFGSNMAVFHRMWSGDTNLPELDLVGNGLTAAYSSAPTWAEKEPISYVPGSVLATTRPTAAITAETILTDALVPMTDLPSREPRYPVPYRFGS